MARVVEDETAAEFYTSLLSSVGSSAPSKDGAPKTSDKVDFSGRIDESDRTVVPSAPSVDVIRDPPLLSSSSSSSWSSSWSSAGPRSSRLSLPRSNIGYRMLERMGWREEEGGLGKDRGGGMEPVKTVVKRDMKGVGGGPRKKSKVTHTFRFSEGCDGGEEGTERDPTMRELKVKLAEEKRREREIALMLNTDLSERDEELYNAVVFRK